MVHDALSWFFFFPPAFFFFFFSPGIYARCGVCTHINDLHRISLAVRPCVLSVCPRRLDGWFRIGSSSLLPLGLYYSFLFPGSRLGCFALRLLLGPFEDLDRAEFSWIMGHYLKSSCSTASHLMGYHFYFNYNLDVFIYIFK
ncbi:hypothetical protein F5B20DRAFT_554329 [Whalleya microplaca]|nr:hypothetical protein F5B20DRAFT_554329 [Whalleya microplaca]